MVVFRFGNKHMTLLLTRRVIPNESHLMLPPVALNPMTRVISGAWGGLM